MESSKAELSAAYMTSMERLSRSATETSERIRHAVLDRSGLRGPPSLDGLQAGFGLERLQAEIVLSDLNENGFVSNAISSAQWRFQNGVDLKNELKCASGLELIAAARLSQLDVWLSVDTWEMRLGRLKDEIGRPGTLPFLFELQRALSTMVASTGEVKLFKRYAAVANTALCYRWSKSLAENRKEPIVGTLEALFDEIAVKKNRASIFEMLSFIRAPEALTELERG